MVTRDTPWPAGTPCWVDVSVDDLPKAIAFYSGLFGWDIEVGPPEAGGYALAHLDGRLAAGIGPKMGDPAAPSAWTTYLATEDADVTADKIKGAGGQLPMPPMDVMEEGRMAIAFDPAGAAFGLWQAGRTNGVAVANEPGSLCWNEQLSADFEGSKAFYRDVFGYEYDDMSGEGFRYATLKVDGNVVGGIGGLPPEIPRPGWRAYFAVTDTDAAVARVTELGGTVAQPAADTPFGRMATVADDHGAVFLLITPFSG
jgi:predicted enzyme related to lactoylglutathione lyase